MNQGPHLLCKEFLSFFSKKNDDYVNSSMYDTQKAKNLYPHIAFNLLPHPILLLLTYLVTFYIDLTFHSILNTFSYSIMFL